MSEMMIWFKIPTLNIERAQEFYESVFEIELISSDDSTQKRRIFKDRNGDHIGELIQCESHKVSDVDGLIVYFTAEQDMETYIKRIEYLGGKITKNVQDDSNSIEFRDTEGNILGIQTAVE